MKALCKRCGVETERRKLRGHQRVGDCIPCKRAERRLYRQRHPQYDNVWQRQRLGIPEPTRPKPQLCEWPGCKRAAFAVDHCHDTGQFRGWLCNAHNLGLGKIGDTKRALCAGLIYLLRAEAEAWLAIPGDGLPRRK